MYNAASYRLGDLVSPGGIFSLFGAELANSTAPAKATPLPRELSGTRVTIGGIDAPLYFVSPGQINYEAPAELPLGMAELVVIRGGQSSARRLVRVVKNTPGIFTAGSGLPIVVHSSDYSLVNAQNPARPGEVLVAFVTGLGLTTPAAVSGEPNPGMPAPLADLSRFQTALDDLLLMPTLYAGLAPGFAGLYQVNFQVDGGATPGLHWLRVSGANLVPLYVR